MAFFDFSTPFFLEKMTQFMCMTPQKHHFFAFHTIMVWLKKLHDAFSKVIVSNKKNPGYFLFFSSPPPAKNKKWPSQHFLEKSSKSW
jgi:hypothetical protein